MAQRSNHPSVRGSDKPDPDRSSGNTTTVQGQSPQRVPRMPHERDESADGQARAEPSNRRVGERAQSDARRGIPDTTKGAELDATYDLLREDLPDGGKQRPEDVNRPANGASRR